MHDGVETTDATKIVEVDEVERGIPTYRRGWPFLRRRSNKRHDRVAALSQ
jgi:hypothetical protein